MEYTLSAGRYTSMDGQDFVDAALKWGSSDHLTFGGGLRYAPSANGRTAVPFAQAWARLGPRLIVEASHAYAFLSKAALRYTLPTMSPLRLSVTRHHAKSRFNRFGKSLEAALSTYLPVQLSPTINVSTFLSTNYTEYYHGRLLSIYGGVTSSLPADLWLRLSSRVQFRNAGGRPLKQVQHATDVHLSKRLLRRILLKPGIRYNHQLHKVTQSQLEISTRLWRYGDISLSARRSHQLKNTSIFLRLSFNLPYARHSSYVSTTQGQPALHQSTSGTIVMDRKNRFYTDDRSWMGTAAARIDPYLDLNGNGQKEQTEPPVDGLKAHIYEVDGSSFPLYRNRRFVSGLTPYRPYLVEIDASSMDNPLWIPSNTMYRLQVAPHTINNLPVPVWVGGEVAGKVKLEGGNQAQMDRLSGLNIYLLGPEGTPPDTLRTYFNGAFFHVGLKPGRYTARLDSQQLASRLLRPVGKDTEFHIEPTMQGDIVEDVNIRVAPNQPEQSLKDTIYTIQIGAFRSRNNATRVIEQARRTTVLVPKIVYDAEDAMYKCQIGLFRTAASASQHLNLLQNKFSDLYEAAFIIDISLKQGTDQ